MIGTGAYVSWMTGTGNWMAVGVYVFWTTTGVGKILVGITDGIGAENGTGTIAGFRLLIGTATLTGKISGDFFSFGNSAAALDNLTNLSALAAFAPATFRAIVFLATRIGAVSALSAAIFDALICNFKWDEH